jgi:hypothetical protein
VNETVSPPSKNVLGLKMEQTKIFFLPFDLKSRDLISLLDRQDGEILNRMTRMNHERKRRKPL